MSRILALRDTVEPMLRAAADVEVDTNAPLEQVLDAIPRLTR